MKAFRIIGTVIGAFLLPLISIILCAALLLFGAANMITDKTINTVVSASMENETVKTTISVALTDSLTTQFLGTNATPEQAEQLQATISDILELPSLQELVSNILTDSADEIISGSFDGELDLSEKISNAIESNPALLEEVTKDLSTSTMQNDTIREMIASSEMATAVFGELEKEEADAILADPAVQELVGKVMADQIVGTLTTSAPALDFAAELGEIIEEKPSLFEPIIQTQIPDEETKASIIQSAADYADSLGVPPPKDNLSDTELVLYLIELYRDQINEQVIGALGATEPDIDYTSPDETVPAPAPSSGNASLSFDEETTAMINTLSGVLHFLRSAAFFLLILCVFIVFYLLMALLTWSFRYPLIFEGISASLTGLLLIAIGALPLVQLLPTDSSDEMTEIILALVTSVWGVLAGKLSLIGIIALVVGIACIAGYIVWTILRKKKTAAPSATPA